MPSIRVDPPHEFYSLVGAAADWKPEHYERLYEGTPACIVLGFLEHRLYHAPVYCDACKHYHARYEDCKD